MATTAALTTAVRAGSALAVVGAGIAVLNRRTAPRLAPGPAVLEPVTVCIPARDEADRLPELLHDLRGQRGIPRLRVLVLDDDSTDDTAAAAQRAFAGDPRFALIRQTGDPPPGWTGKAAACARLADTAHTPVLVFLDADVRLHPDALAAAVTQLRRRGVGMVAPWPRQDAETVVERLIQPLLAWSWCASLPLRWGNASLRPSTAVACGQFLVCEAGAYHRAGGHAMVAGSPTDDLDLARAFRRTGAHTELVLAGGLASCRMYRHAAELDRGYTRWLWSAYRSPAGSLAVAVLLTWAYLLPPLAALVGRGPARRWGLVGYAAGVASRLLARSAEGAGLDAGAAAHPISVAGYLVLTLRSYRARRRGTTTWRGRSTLLSAARPPSR